MKARRNTLLRAGFGSVRRGRDHASRRVRRRNDQAMRGGTATCRKPGEVADTMDGRFIFPGRVRVVLSPQGNVLGPTLRQHRGRREPYHAGIGNLTKAREMHGCGRWDLRRSLLQANDFLVTLLVACGKRASGTTPLFLSCSPASGVILSPFLCPQTANGERRRFRLPLMSNSRMRLLAGNADGSQIGKTQMNTDDVALLHKTFRAQSARPSDSSPRGSPASHARSIPKLRREDRLAGNFLPEFLHLGFHQLDNLRCT